MKSSSLAITTTALLSFSFTRLALAAIPFIANCQPTPDTNNAKTNCYNPYIDIKPSQDIPVNDINGEAVITGKDYYIIPADAKGGGISLITGRCGDGLKDVILHPNCSIKGSKIRFSREGSPSGNDVQQWSNLNFIFSESPDNRSWSVGKYDESFAQWFITNGGVEGNPLLNWFKFVSTDVGRNTYKIIHCPFVCPTCNHIGLSPPDGVGPWRLVVLHNGQEALSFNIVPAPPPCVLTC